MTSELQQTSSSTMGDEDDNYWNASAAKGFSWDDQDDAIGLPALSISSSTTSGPDDLVSFDASSDAASSTRWAERVREASRQIAAAASLPEPASISQVVGQRDVRRLEQELATLRTNYAALQANRFSPLPPAQTVRDMVLGRPYSLQGYTSLQDKEALLDAALEMGDGDTVLTVTIMLRNSLKRAKFHQLVAARQEAAAVLVAHLVTRLELAAAVELLQALDRSHEAGVAAVRQATHSGNIEVRVRALKQTLSSAVFRGHIDSDAVLEQVHLLERLAPVICSEVGEVGRGAGSLGQASVLRALLYLCQHHYTAGENLLHSPSALRKLHRLTDRQFTWVALRARAAATAWGDCEALVVGKGWLGKKKAIGSVNPGEVAVLLHGAGAPGESLTAVLELVEGGEERLSLARRLGVAAVVVDCLLAAKDRLALLSYQGSMTPNSRDWFYADNALKNSNVKWKN